jgi:hypothetical protein
VPMRVMNSILFWASCLEADECSQDEIDHAEPDSKQNLVRHLHKVEENDKGVGEARLRFKDELRAGTREGAGVGSREKLTKSMQLGVHLATVDTSRGRRQGEAGGSCNQALSLLRR